jgi:hypothetical protein
MKRLLLLFSLLALPLRATACLWDSDTLAHEARGIPDVVYVMAGRFERNPPLYYQMRLARVTAEIAAHPDHLAAYDDAAVACDRLEHDTEAIAWIDKKRAALNGLPATDPAVKEHWYHYYANRGTFFVHRWLREGADAGNMADAEQAKNDIAKAIEINPNAHFGREKYQLLVIEWILDGGGQLSRYMKDHVDDRSGMIRGLSGLVALGNAWESVDVYEAIANSDDRNQQIVCYMAGLRMTELIANGRGSLGGGTPRAGRIILGAGTRAEADYQFHRLRAEADAWQKNREAYMMPRLRAGRHPDTDPAFWADYHDPGPPSLRSPWTVAWRFAVMNVLLSEDFLLLVFPALLLVVLVVSVRLVFRFIRRVGRSRVTGRA